MSRIQIEVVISSILIAHQIILIQPPVANCLAIDTKPANGQLIEQISSPSAASKLMKEYRQPDFRRPIWNLAHMVNSIKELEYRLR